MNEKSTPEYWNKRVLEMVGNDRALVYESPGFERTQEIGELFIRNFVKRGDTFLDMGCGYGRFYDVVKEVGAEYTGIDFSQEMIEEAKKRHPLGDFRKRNWLEFGGQYNVVFECICGSSLEEGKDADKMGAWMNLLTKDGGIMIMLEPPICAVMCKGNIFIK